MTLLEQLQRIKTSGPNNRNSGICGLLLLDSVDNGILMHLMCSWPKFSGTYAYPIPSTRKGLTPRECYNIHCRKHAHWAGVSAYSKLRYELLDYLIAELSKDAAC